ncbi:MAG TPA: DUF2752 domain-containing protein [Acidobacteria bacterium]|nr:DUF2752 domain-containing protein [Acidobacteriota bacterium]
MTWREPRPEERQLAWIWGLSAVVGIALAPVWPRLVPLLPRCAFHRLTGYPCPTCGTTRAALALLHGHILQAIVYNPLMAVLGCAFVAGGILAPLWALAGLPLPVVPSNAWKPLRIAALLAILVNWAYLLLAGR